MLRAEDFRVKYFRARMYCMYGIKFRVKNTVLNFYNNNIRIFESPTIYGFPDPWLDRLLIPWYIVYSILVQCNKAMRYEYGMVGHRHVTTKLWRGLQVVSMNPVDTVS